jgi:hypothetical protein
MSWKESFYDWLANRIEDRFNEEEIKCGLTVGEHMQVVTSCDNKNIPPVTARIHLSYNLPQLDEDDNLIRYAREFRKSALASLRILAFLCQKGYPDYQGVEVFYGISPLANKNLERWGFTISDAPLAERIKVSLKYRYLLTEVLGKNRSWRRHPFKLYNPHTASITREKLIEMHGVRGLDKI